MLPAEQRDGEARLTVDGLRRRRAQAARSGHAVDPIERIDGDRQTSTRGAPTRATHARAVARAANER
jgi:hypothetical protein